MALAVFILVSLMKHLGWPFTNLPAIEPPIYRFA